MLHSVPFSENDYYSQTTRSYLIYLKHITYTFPERKPFSQNDNYRYLFSFCVVTKRTSQPAKQATEWTQKMTELVKKAADRAVLIPEHCGSTGH